MKILFVTPSYKPAYIYGGPAISVSELAEALSSDGHEVVVYTTTANGSEELKVETKRPVNINGVTIYYFKRQTGDHTHVSVGLWQKLFHTANSFDVINLQSWWSPLIFGAAAICRLKGKKYFVSPRGMLSAYTFESRKGLIKHLLHQIIGKPLLRFGYLHATTRLEWDDSHLVLPHWKGFILPNLVRFPAVNETDTKMGKERTGIVFGFLSRIDPKKGLELLFEALATVHYPYRLKIAGSGEKAYITSLKTLAVRLGVDQNIEWCGWKGDQEKFSFLSTIDVFVLTSYNENFANSVIESLVNGRPVLLTDRVGLAEYIMANGFGWVCETNVLSVAESLSQVWTNKWRLPAMGERAQTQVRIDFNQKHLASLYANEYKKFLC